MPTDTFGSFEKVLRMGEGRRLKRLASPSALAITVGSPPSRTATTELVVPRSMPMARVMGAS